MLRPTVGLSCGGKSEWELLKRARSGEACTETSEVTVLDEAVERGRGLDLAVMVKGAGAAAAAG